MKTIIVVGPCLSMGGMERAASNTVDGLIDLYPEQRVVFISILKKKIFFDISSKAIFHEPENFNEKKMSFIKTIIYLRKTIFEYNSSSLNVLVFGKFYGALTSMALMGSNIDLYISHRQSPLFVWDRKIHYFNRLAYFLNPPIGVIAQTTEAEVFLKKYFPNSKVITIPNSVREVRLHPEIKRAKVILAVGRLNDHLKGFDLLLESFALLKNQEWQLHIAGGDENGVALKNQAEKLGIRHRVKFLGAVKDIDRCYAYAGIYVIPSRSEGFPNALAEAMAAGCCCVAFDFVAGPRDLISYNKNGVIIPESDINALAMAIDELILDGIKRDDLGKNAMAVREKLKQSVIVDRIKTFLEDGK